jgi:hypothetical protein
MKPIACWSFICDFYLKLKSPIAWEDFITFSFSSLSVFTFHCEVLEQ